MDSVTGGEDRPEVLIVDDEMWLRRGKARLLEGGGFAVREARDGEDALAAIARRRPDLVLLDVDMPKLDGYTTCREIRRIDPLLPVVFLTAYAGDDDRARGLGLGGDDYIAKESNDAVLLASVRRAIARSAAIRSAAVPRRARIGRAEVDFDALTVRLPEGEERLTRTEAGILWLLHSERGRVVGYGEMLEVLLGSGCAGDEHMLQVHVNRLRGKLGNAGALIRNNRGVGYALVVERTGK